MASSRFSSTFTLTTLALPERAISATTGAICRQGSHQGAQKSTSTGPSSASTSRLNASSPTTSTSGGTVSASAAAAEPSAAGLASCEEQPGSAMLAPNAISSTPHTALTALARSRRNLSAPLSWSTKSAERTSGTPSPAE